MERDTNAFKKKKILKYDKVWDADLTCKLGMQNQGMVCASD